MTGHEHGDECIGCGDGMSDVEIVQRYADLIAEYGWAVVGVVSEEEPAWLYTVGVQQTFNHPELVIYGLEPRQAHGLLITAIEQIRKGHQYEPSTLDDTILGGGYSMAVVKVDEPLDPLYPLNMAAQFTEEVEAVQLVWPSADHLFPWAPNGQKEQAVFGTFEVTA
jgi:hypothetical protein